MHPNPNLAVTTLTTCLDEIKAWMHDSFFKLNETKTEFLFVGTPTALRKFNSSNLINDFVTSSAQVRNLGVIFDPQLLFDAHIKMVPSKKYRQTSTFFIAAGCRKTYSCFYYVAA